MEGLISFHCRLQTLHLEEAPWTEEVPVDDNIHQHGVEQEREFLLTNNSLLEELSGRSFVKTRCYPSVERETEELLL